MIKDGVKPNIWYRIANGGVICLRAGATSQALRCCYVQEESNKYLVNCHWNTEGEFPIGVPGGSKEFRIVSIAYE